MVCFFLITILIVLITYAESDCTIVGLGCGTCLNSTSDNFWCSNPQFCFLNSSSENYLSCSSKCNGNLLTSADKSSCNQINYPMGVIVVSFIIMILCPLCILCGCVYVVVMRCRFLTINKVGIAPQEVESIPMQQVYAATATYGEMNNPFNNYNNVELAAAQAFPVSTSSRSNRNLGTYCLAETEVINVNSNTSERSSSPIRSSAITVVASPVRSY